MKRQSNISKIIQLFNTVSLEEAKTLIDVAKAVIYTRSEHSKVRPELKIKTKPAFVGTSVSVAVDLPKKISETLKETEK